MNVTGAASKIKGIAAYIAAAVFVVALTAFCRYIDGALFARALPFRPAELAAEALIIISAVKYIAKNTHKADIKAVKRHIPVAVIPLLLVFAAFFCMPATAEPKLFFAVLADTFSTSFAEDLMLCAVGCTLLIHKNKMNGAAVFLMLLCMAVYDAALSGETPDELVFSVPAALVIGFFEIYLHLSTESSLFCAAFHFLLKAMTGFPSFTSAKTEPFIGVDASVVLYILSLSVMAVLGFIMREKRKTRMLEDTEFE